MANNLANVNTVGFKPMRTAFADLMYQNLNRVRNENVAMTGHGVKINKNDLMMHQGSLQPTDMPLDFSILDANGFFAVETPSGEIKYSRAGNFSLSNVDGTFFLVNGEGNRVLDAEGEQIEVEFEQVERKIPELDEDGNPKLDEDGNIIYNISFSDGDPIVGAEQIGVYRFPNPYGLDAIDANSFVQTDISGEAEAVEAPRLKQGYIEASAVDIAQEMANVIEASKAFSFSSRMVTVADEIEQTVNQMR